MPKSLSNREFEIVEHIVFYGSKKEAAEPLKITVRTLETHIKNIFRKLSISKNNELVLWYCANKFNIEEQIRAIKQEIVCSPKKFMTVAMLIFCLSTHSNDLQASQKRQNRVVHTTNLRQRRIRRTQKGRSINLNMVYSLTA